MLSKGTLGYHVGKLLAKREPELYAELEKEVLKGYKPRGRTKKQTFAEVNDKVKEILDNRDADAVITTRGPSIEELAGRKTPMLDKLRARVAKAEADAN